MTVAAAGMLGLAFVGCRSSKTVWSKDTPFGKMQKRATEVIEAGGLAGVGVDVSQSPQTAMDKAKLSARLELAQIIETKVELLRKDFVEEIGEAKTDEYNALFSSTAKAVASQILHGTVPVDIQYRTKDGRTEAWVLVVQTPEILENALANQASAQRAMYTRFRASEAFKELQKEIAAFEKYKSDHSWLQALPETAPKNDSN